MLKRFIFSIILVVICVTSLWAGQKVEEGYQALNKGDYATALSVFEPLAAQGDAGAQAGLASMYYEGVGVEKNAKKAVNLAREAAKKKHVIAQYILYYAYQSGNGVEQDGKKAFDWLSLSAESGYPPAQLTIAQVYFYDKDYYRSLTWAQLAAKHDVPNALTLIGNHYALGAGVKQDDTQAASWYKKAAIKGDAEAQYWLGEMYYTGRGVERNEAEGEKWMTQSAKQGFAMAKGWLRENTKSGAGGKHTR
jgi:uncharacterized protein